MGNGGNGRLNMDEGSLVDEPYGAEYGIMFVASNGSWMDILVMGLSCALNGSDISFSCSWPSSSAVPSLSFTGR